MKKIQTNNAKHVESTKDVDKKAPDDKKKSKNEIFVKQSYAQPNDNIRKYIPFCSNIYNIQKNEN